MSTKFNILMLIGLIFLTAAIAYFLTQNDTYYRKINEAPQSNAMREDLGEDTQSIPAFTFTGLDGQTYQSSDFAGKIIVLNFWASWCAPCVKEFPDLLAAADANKDNVIFIAISLDTSSEAIEKFKNKMEKLHGLDFSGENIYIALDNAQNPIAEQFQSYKLPETYIIDQNQNIRHKLIGANWQREDLLKIIEQLGAMH